MRYADLEGATLLDVVMYQVGNKGRDEGIGLASKQIEITEDVESLINNVFLGRIEQKELYEIGTSGDDTLLVKVWQQATNIFDNPEGNFKEEAENMVKGLYDQMQDPNIGGGVFILLYYNNIVVEDELVDGIAIFKTENTEMYFDKIREHGTSDWWLETHDGWNPKSIDKGCLILNVDKETGYRVLLGTKKKVTRKMKYFYESYLGLSEVQTPSFLTRSYVEMVKNYSCTLANPLLVLNFLTAAKQFLSHYTEVYDEYFAEIVFDAVEELDQISTWLDFIKEYRSANGIEDAPFFVCKDTLKKNMKKLQPKLVLDGVVELSASQRNRIVEGEDEEGRYVKTYYLESKIK